MNSLNEWICYLCKSGNCIVKALITRLVEFFLTHEKRNNCSEVYRSEISYLYSYHKLFLIVANAKEKPFFTRNI